MHELRPGERFGHYEIVRPVGVGAFGRVYESRRLPMGRRVALKVLHRHLVREPEAVERFLREVERVATLEHPHIVALVDADVHDGQPYLATPFLEGETLSERIARTGALTVAEALDIMVPVLSAVATTHDVGVVHRALGASSIFLERQSTGHTLPVVLDYGMAQIEEATLSQTQTSAMMQAPFYLSPEQARGDAHADPRSDLWSLGVTLFECLTGCRPFPGASAGQVLRAILGAPAPRPSNVNPNIPPALDALLARALSRDIDARWQSARDFAAALLPFARPQTRSTWQPVFAAPGDGAAPLASTMYFDGPSAAPLDVPSGTQILDEPPQAPAFDLGATVVSAPPSTSQQGGLERTRMLDPSVDPMGLSAGPSHPKEPAIAATMAVDPGNAAMLWSQPPTAGVHGGLPGAAPARAASRVPTTVKRRRWPWVVAALTLVGAGIAVALVALDEDQAPAARPTAVSTTVNTTVNSAEAPPEAADASQGAVAAPASTEAPSVATTANAPAAAKPAAVTRRTQPVVVRRTRGHAIDALLKGLGL